MSSNVVFLHGEPPRVGHFIRVGTSGHRQLETLLASGKMPIESVVFEAGVLKRQHELFTSLKDAGREIILDTNVAELSCAGKYEGYAKGAPWADQDSVLTPEHFLKGSNFDLIGKIARSVVQDGVDVVLSPAHLLSSSTSPWLKIDRESCIALRRALDSEGGKHIVIDYPLMVTFAVLRDPIQRRALVNNLADLPFDNLWLRVSGFGSDATATGLRRYIAAGTDFLSLGRPIIADGTGGLAGLATVAFGAAGGISHGIAEKERFDASGWDKPRSSGGGGNERRVLVLGLDRLLSMKQMQALMETQGGQRICSCID